MRVYNPFIVDWPYGKCYRKFFKSVDIWHEIRDAPWFINIRYKITESKNKKKKICLSVCKRKRFLDRKAFFARWCDSAQPNPNRFRYTYVFRQNPYTQM